MPMAAALLKPGVDVQKTPSLNEAGVSVSQLLRYREGLIETYGGWVPYGTSPSTVRDLHAWQDAAGVKHLGIGATHNLIVVTSGSNADVTPQTATTNFLVDFSATIGSSIITIVDTNSSGLASVFDTVFFNTPIAIAGGFLNGAYKIVSVLSSISYTIGSSFISSAAIVSSGILPTFSVSSGTGTVLVTLPNNNFLDVSGLFYSFIAPTTVGGLTVQGPYEVQSILNSTQFTINSPTQAATTASSITMNSSFAQLVYYVTLGPQLQGSGFGSGGFGSGGFGTGTIIVGAPGTPIVTDDWTMDNWGQILLACPKDGPIYAWSPDNGFVTAQVITQAPFSNGGIFVSMPYQILVAWKSCQSTGTQDNLIVRWSDQEDFTNWVVSNQTTAGSFHIPTGSVLRGGMQGPTQGLIWTDIDIWVMQYVGGDLIFNFNRVGSGCGLVGPHAMGTLSGQVFWMGPDNFFMLSGSGVQVIPCAVWDFVFQNINQTYITRVKCAPNSAFSEIAWFFPSTNSTGENDSYVKFNIVEQEWDYGTMPRTAWVDVSILGNPIGADPAGNLYQHETGNVNSGVSAPSFQSGWWSITEGNDLAFVDYVIPDFKYGKFSGPDDANIQITFFAADYPGDSPRSYGPYSVTTATEFLTPRIRGRLMSILVQGNGQSFWRLGKVRYRYALAGRR